MNKKFKDIIRQIHLWLGLGTGIIVFIISITGGIFVFEDEIRTFIQKDYLEVPVEQKEFAGLDKLIQSFEKIAPEQKITSIRVTDHKPNATVAFTTGKKIVYYLNPYNGALVKKTGQDFLVTVQHIHTSLLLGETGEFIIRWSVVIFVIMLISGLILWFPNQMRLLKQSLKIKWNASFKRVNYDLHNVLGFYASIILLFIALSGLYFTFKSVKVAASFITGSKLSEGIKVKSTKPNPQDTASLDYNTIYSKAAREFPGADFTNISIRKDGEIRLRLNYPSKWARKQNTFFFNAKTGKLLRYKLYKDANGADLIEAANYDFHTGKLLGWFSKIVWFIIALISASLPITGFIIWLKKRKKSKRKQPIYSKKGLKNFLLRNKTPKPLVEHTV